MKDELFDESLESVRQGGAILLRQGQGRASDHILVDHGEVEVKSGIASTDSGKLHILWESGDPWWNGAAPRHVPRPSGGDGGSGIRGGRS